MTMDYGDMIEGAKYDTQLRAEMFVGLDETIQYKEGKRLHKEYISDKLKNYPRGMGYSLAEHGYENDILLLAKYIKMRRKAAQDK